jgi:hypothetical protein
MTIYMQQPIRHNENFNPSMGFDPQTQIRIIKNPPS